MAEEKAKAALGYYDAEFVRYATFTPDHAGLPEVNVAYVPLTANKQQAVLSELDRMNRAERGKADVQLVARHLRAWDLRRGDGSVADCRNAAEIGERVDALIVRGIAQLILDSRSSEGAEAALANFSPK